jgi:O-antigen ligase
MKLISLRSEPLLWLRPLLIIALLLLSVVLGLRASQSLLMLVLLPVVGVGLIVACLRYPALGLIVAASAGLVVPWVGPSGLNVTMVLVALLLGLWLLDMMVRQRQVRLVSSRPIWSLLVFILIGFISFGIGQLPWFTFALHAPLGAQAGGLSIIVLSAGAFLLMGNQVHDLVWLRRITWTFLAIAALTIVFRSVLPEFGFNTRELFQSVGSVFYVWVVAITFSQAVFNRELHVGWRLALVALLLVTLYVLIFLKFSDKSGWASCFVCLIAIIGFRSWRTLLALTPFAAVAVFFLEPELLNGVINAENYSISTRFEAWVILAQMIQVSPLWGLGFANYYWYTPLFPIRGYAVSFNSHNNFVDIVAQMGVVGLLCFLLFFGEVGRLAWRLRERVPSGFARAYVYGAWGGLVGMIVLGMFGDWVLPFFYNIGLNGFRTSMLGWLFLGGLVSLEQMTNREGLHPVDQDGRHD